MKLGLSYDKLTGIVKQNPKPPSQLQKAPCCSSVHLVLKGDWPGKTGKDAQGESTTADTPPSVAVEDLLAWPFEGLPLHRRQQITRLGLSTQEYSSELGAHLPLILSRLGPLLPAMTHLDIRSCRISRWGGWDKEDLSQLYAAVASAFPNLTSLTTSGSSVNMEQFAHHLGDQLQVLELGKPGEDFTWEPSTEALQHLPRLGRLRQLVMNSAGWDEAEDWNPREDGEDPDFSSDYDEEEDEGSDDEGGMGDGMGWEDGEEEGGVAGVAQGGPGAAAGEGGAAAAQGAWQQQAAPAGQGQAGQQGVVMGLDGLWVENWLVGGGEGGGVAGAGPEQGGMGGEQQGDGVPLFMQTGANRFKAFLGSLPPSLEQLRLRDFAVHTRTRDQRLLKGRELQIDLAGGKAHTLRAGWAATVRQLRFLVRWVRQSRLGPSTQRGTIPVLEATELEDKHGMWLGYTDHPDFLLRRVQRVDIGKLRLTGKVVPDALARFVLLYRPQVVELQGVEVRLRASGALSLRDGEDEELAKTLRRQHVRQQQEVQKQKQGQAGSRAAGEAAAGGASGQAGVAGDAVAELYLRTAGTEDVKAAALGPLRRALTAAAAAAALAAGAAAAGAGQAGGSGGSDGAAAGGSGIVGLPGLAVVPADSRNSSHRLVLLWGPFLTVLGVGKALDLWLNTQRSAMKLKHDRVWSPEHGKRICVKVQPARYLRLPADKEAGAGGCAASVVVQCESAEVAESFCAAAAAVAATAKGGLQVVRLAGSSLDSAVFQPCTSPVG